MAADTFSLLLGTDDIAAGEQPVGDAQRVPGPPTGWAGGVSCHLISPSTPLGALVENVENREALATTHRYKHR